MTLAAIGVGSNLGDPPANVAKGLRALGSAGRVVAHSRTYRTKPWGLTDQPDFCNAVALLETALPPRRLLEELKRIEKAMGRVEGERWGPRLIDLDILTFAGAHVDEPGLRIPHAKLYERAFALVPLAELDPSFQSAVEALDPSERAGVFPLERGETRALMSDDALIERVRALTEAFVETDLVRLRITGENEDAVELRKPHSAPARKLAAAAVATPQAAPPVKYDAIKADLVGIVHFTRPLVREGDRIDGDRELAHVEALGIRNPVRSLGEGRVAGVLCKEGQAVEYGQVLFEIDRG